MSEDIPAGNNIVYTRRGTDSILTQKDVLGEVYRIHLPKKNRIKWKLIPGQNKIAGCDCLKAEGTILDSIQVIAYFFTEQLNIEAGPESFSGLPVLILQFGYQVSI